MTQMMIAFRISPKYAETPLAMSRMMTSGLLK